MGGHIDMSLKIRPEIRFTVETKPSCTNINNGEIHIENESRYSQYKYLWSNGSQKLKLDKLSSGIYTVTVSHEKCTIIEKIEVPATTIVTNDWWHIPNCRESYFSLWSIPTGGTYPYDYKWNTGHDFLSFFTCGTYSVTITDDKGCAVSKQIEFPEPIQIKSEYTQSCTQGMGEIKTYVTGGSSPYVFRWSNGDTTQNLSHLDPGKYVLTVSDTFGCDFHHTVELLDTKEKAIIFEKKPKPICMNEQEEWLRT